MPRAPNGQYTLPAGNPVVSGTVIESTWANTTMDDLANEMTDSLSRTGNGSMQAPLKLAQGLVSAPTLTFNNDPITGDYLAAVGDMRRAVQGIDSMRWIASGVEVWDDTDMAFYPILSNKDQDQNVETQTLASGQTVVVFVNNIEGASVYINGPDADNGRLVIGTDYTYDSGTKTVTLTESRPAGTLITANRIGGFDPAPSQTPLIYDTEAQLIAADLAVGTLAETKGQTVPGDGFAANFLVELPQPLVGRDLQLTNGNTAKFQTDVVTKSGAKNLLINSDFSVWQRNTAFVGGALSAYTADRWKVSAFTDANRVTTNIAPTAAYGLQVVTQGVGITVINQGIELSAAGAAGIFQIGTQLSYSFWAISDTNTTCDVNMAFRDVSGTGTNQVVAVTPDVITITPTLTKYQGTLTINASPNPTNILIDFLINEQAQAANNITFSQVQLEQGQSPTAFQTQGGSIGAELALCQRFYEKTYDVNVDPGTATTTGSAQFVVGTNTTATNTLRYYGNFKVRKRGTPTVTVYDAAGNSGVATHLDQAGPATDNQPLAIGLVGETGFRASTAIGGIAGWVFHYTADAEL